MKTHAISRRELLKTSGALVVSFSLFGPATRRSGASNLTLCLFLRAPILTTIRIISTRPRWIPGWR